METENLMENITKKLIPSISPIINNELELFLRKEISKIESRLVIENKEVLSVEMDRLKQESERNSQERGELEKIRIEYLERSLVLEEKLRETSEDIDATRKVSIYKRYEKTIEDKKGELKIMSFRLKSLEEQLRKAREKSNDTICNNIIETKPEVVTSLDLEPEVESQDIITTISVNVEDDEEEKEEEEEETELEWVVYKKKNYLTDSEY